MEESELDEWFNEQREKLEEKVYADINGKNPQRAKEEFDKRYRALIAEFQKKQAQIYESKERSARMQKPIAAVKLNLGLAWQACTGPFRRMKPAIKKWFFERKIRKILRDKSDL
jgi:bisphosphoglycerate-dependent phosphoglycerate mutase